VDLCGHATLATAYVLFEIENYPESTIHFDSRSGILTVRKEGDWLVMDFPVDTIQKTAIVPPALLESLNGLKPLEVLKGKTDYMVVVETQQQVSDLQPDTRTLATVPARGLIVTAPGDDTDFVSRFFAPQSGIDEDPVTGSAHTTLVPYWAQKLGKTEFDARQISPRGGVIKAKLLGDRVEIAGQAKLYLRGTIETA
jgi:PhzF family phenazine biosynthesis protein